MIDCGLWKSRLANRLDREGHMVSFTSGGIRVELPDRRAIDVDKWGRSYLFTEMTWDETGGLVSEENLADTESESELVDIATSLISNYE
ncbi:hypothetical protein PP459_gp056 [Streptomyces phage Wakanda]|uniref:Uncharacterized protein n=1 Tax=Streptomyces phage Wakanda TaxID=2713267 RepID=A0A6G8R1V3_9CAUD|nr:hypothetical protein PP459_gp056 [Streptomyces phage Wakanda]QIN94177.1 hypothetical protein SEA_WAKANDA_216 [Streptomyces phage Wakanda]